MPKTLEEAQAEITRLTGVNTTLTADLTKATKANGEKDAVIEQKNKDIVGLRKSSEVEYKKLQDMTDEEKGKMSEKEIELQKRQEKLEEDTRLFQESQAESAKKEVDARKERAIAAIAGKDPALKQKILDNYARIADADKATTDEEVAKIAGDAFNMLGVPKPAGVGPVVNGAGGGTVGGDDVTGFADTAAGKSVAQAMGLPTALADNGGGGGGGADAGGGAAAA